ncbi:hypothetical protein [Nocardia sp. NPDC004604]
MRHEHTTEIGTPTRVFVVVIPTALATMRRAGGNGAHVTDD